MNGVDQPDFNDCSNGIPRHVAIIMDGNGRWAKQRGLPRTAGHRQGVETVREIVKAAGKAGIEYLTLFSFSSENWNRPAAEISELFSLLRYFIRRDLAELHDSNVKIKVIGQREGVPEDVLSLLDEAQALTNENEGQTLVIAFNYGSRGEIAASARKLAQQAVDGIISPSQIDEEMFSHALETDGIPDPDLLIRTSGEIRLSNFLLWQSAYTEFVFLDCLWPDFSSSEFLDAIGEYARRTRKFGGLNRDTGS
ncbi:MAG: isoprenyl transferase [Rhizobiaceae bacterium]